MRQSSKRMRDGKGVEREDRSQSDGGERLYYVFKIKTERMRLGRRNVVKERRAELR